MIRNPMMPDDAPFDVEPILPSQYFEDRLRNREFEPVKRLMLAVLADAVRCYQSGLDARTTQRRRIFRETEKWLFDNNVDGPFSFVNVCEALDIDCVFLRRRLRRWRLAKLGGARSALIRRPLVIPVKRALRAK